MDTFLRVYLPIYFVVCLLVVFIMPTIIIYRKTKINPVVFGKTDTAHDYIGRVMKLIMLIIFSAILIFALGDKIYSYSGRLIWAELLGLKMLGIAISLISLVWISISQFAMKDSWRIGIDVENSSALVTSGAFSICRNPIFLGMILTMFSLFLMIPNALTFFTAFTSLFLIQIQIRLEEEFLQKQHGNEYLEYKLRVNRLIPSIFNKA